MAKIYRDKDADLAVLKDKTIAFIGYGNQGRSQALNMRDSDLKVTVGNIKDRYSDQAKQDGFEVLEIAEATKRANVICVLVPDEITPAIFEEQIEPNLEEKDVLCFASGYNIFYKYIVPPSFVDVVLLAPRMIGKMVRDLYLEGSGAMTLIGVALDSSGRAKQIVLSLAKAIGATRVGAIESSFEEETKVDLFGEQVSGGKLFMARLAFEVLVEAGCSPEVALLELYASGEGIAGQKAIVEQGLWNQLKLHSPTSQYGKLTVGSRLVNDDTKRLLKSIMKNIENGSFAREWTLEQEISKKKFKSLWENGLKHPMLKAEDELYRLLGRR